MGTSKAFLFQPGSHPLTHLILLSSLVCPTHCHSSRTSCSFLLDSFVTLPCVPSPCHYFRLLCYNAIIPSPLISLPSFTSTIISSSSTTHATPCINTFTLRSRERPLSSFLEKADRSSQEVLGVSRGPAHIDFPKFGVVGWEGRRTPWRIPRLIGSILMNPFPLPHFLSLS